jgi:hypothetical protein
LPKGHRLYRVFTNTRPPTEFNPGIGAATRFGFFGKPVVPIMYAADTEEAAVAESLLQQRRGLRILRRPVRWRVRSRHIARAYFRQPR